MLFARTRRPLFIGRARFRVSGFHNTSAWWATTVQRFKLADIGEGITECEVVKWSVKPQATVKPFDLLCEVQSDKASVEITSPYSGVVKELLVQEGEMAKVGEGICLIEVESEGSGSTDSALEKPASLPSEPKEEDVKASEPKRNEGSQERRPHPLDPNFPQDAAKILGDSSRSALAVPSVRHFARQNGVFDLSDLMPGSGRNGRIEKKDVEAYLAATADGGSVSATRKEDTVVELGRTRYGMWKAMVKSLEIPHFGYSTTLDLTALHELLPTLNAHIPDQYRPPSQLPSSEAVSSASLIPPLSPPPVSPSGQFTRLTYLPILLKTLSRAMMEWPLLRASITPVSSTEPPSKPTLTVRPQADISIALSTPTGLYTPTIQDVNAYSVYALASKLKHLSHLGRQIPSGLTPNEMPKRGGTLTVSNVGAIGAGEFASPVLVPGGGVAIVAIGRAKWVWDVDRRPEGERRLKVGVSWSADHRVVEGAELAAFVESWRGWVENPQRLIADSV